MKSKQLNEQIRQHDLRVHMLMLLRQGITRETIEACVREHVKEHRGERVSMNRTPANGIDKLVTLVSQQENADGRASTQEGS